MDYLDFLATAMIRNRILDLERKSTPQQVEASLGAGFIDDVEKRRRYFRRDYGLIEFTFVRDVDWVCRNAIVQAHRLLKGGPVPPAIEDVYGPFPSRVTLVDLASRVEQFGSRLVRASRDSDKPYERYTAGPTGIAEMYVVGAEFGVGDQWPRGGELWSLAVW